jgi:hypothetical protein
LATDKRKSTKAKLTRGKRVPESIAQSNLFEVIQEAEKTPVPTVHLNHADYSFKYETPTRMKLAENGSVLDFHLELKNKGSELLANLDFADSTGEKAEIVIELNSKSVGAYQHIKLQSTWYDPSKPYVLWDAMNLAVAAISPYPSLHELYGHFTEPKPKFKIIKIELPKDASPFTMLLHWMSDFPNTFDTHPLGVLDSMGFDTKNESKLIKQLREKRIDLRTNLTNHRIKDGEFRICYPFTLPIDRKTFVTIK